MELLFDGYIYQKKDKLSNGLSWRCKKRSCPARAKTDFLANGFNLRKDHDHPPCDSAIKVRQFIVDLKKAIYKNPGSVEQTYKDQKVKFVENYPQYSGNLPTFQ